MNASLSVRCTGDGRTTRSLETEGAGGRDAGARAERGEARRGEGRGGTSVGRARDGVVERVDDA